eukprot:scpid109508/ scgid22031/ 
MRLSRKRCSRFYSGGGEEKLLVACQRESHLGQCLRLDQLRTCSLGLFCCENPLLRCKTDGMNEAEMGKQRAGVNTNCICVLVCNNSDGSQVTTILLSGKSR